MAVQRNSGMGDPPSGAGLSCCAPSPGQPGLGPGGLRSLSRARWRQPAAAGATGADPRRRRTGPPTSAAGAARRPASPSSRRLRRALGCARRRAAVRLPGGTGSTPATRRRSACPATGRSRSARGCPGGGPCRPCQDGDVAGNRRERSAGGRDRADTRLCAVLSTDRSDARADRCVPEIPGTYTQPLTVPVQGALKRPKPPTLVLLLHRCCRLCGMPR